MPLPRNQNQILFIGIGVFEILAVLTTFQMQMVNAVQWNTYSTDTYSYNYPSNWTLKERENRFTSIDSELEYKDAMVQFESSDNLDQTFTGLTDNAVLEGLEYGALNLPTRENSVTYEKGIDKYVINGHTAPYVITTFQGKDVYGNDYNFVTMYLVIKVNEHVVVATYGAQENNFDKYLGTAEKILASVKPKPPVISNVQ